MTNPDRQALIAQYKDGYRAVRDALAGAADADLDRRPAPGKWTAREIVHHLADSEMTSAIRLRRLLAEDQPVIVGYDQEAFARTLHYDRPIAASLDAFRAARRVNGGDPRAADRRGLAARRARTARAAATASTLARDLRRPRA